MVRTPVPVVESNNRKIMNSSSNNSENMVRYSSGTIPSVVGADEAGVAEEADVAEENEEGRVKEAAEHRVEDVVVGGAEVEPAMALIMEVGCTASLAARVQGLRAAMLGLALSDVGD